MNRKILYIQYTNPAAYPPLEHSSRILARAGWEVLFLGTGALGAGALRFPVQPNISVRRMPFSPAGWRQKVHFLHYCLWVLGWTLRWRPGWIYASEHGSCPVVLLLGFLPWVKVIYHEHDSPGNAHKQSAFMCLMLAARQRVARRAALCVLPNIQRSLHFARHVTDKRPIVTVWNCPRLEEVAPTREGNGDRILQVLYHGSIVPARLPVTVLDALAILPASVRLRVVGYETIGHQGYVETLKDHAHRLGVSERVEFMDAVPRHELLERCGACDVGLALMPRMTGDINMDYMVGASNKPFDYLASGLALLVSNLPSWREMYVEAGYGLACDPERSESIAEALRWYLERPQEMRAMGEAGRQRLLNEWNYEAQFAPVLKCLEQ